MSTENVRFNERVYMDIMHIEDKPVLQLFDKATQFSAAQFLKNASTNAIWEFIIQCWSSVCMGLLDTFIVDSGSQFRKTYANIAAVSLVKAQRTGVEAHSSLNIGERKHQPLIQTFRKLRIDHPKISIYLLHYIAVKTLNDTMGPDGVVPSGLVLWRLPECAVV